jgi:hypothetical protein
MPSNLFCPGHIKIQNAQKEYFVKISQIDFFELSRKLIKCRRLSLISFRNFFLERMDRYRKKVLVSDTNKRSSSHTHIHSTVNILYILV